MKVTFPKRKFHRSVFINDVRDFVASAWMEKANNRKQFPHRVIFETLEKVITIVGRRIIRKKCCKTSMIFRRVETATPIGNENQQCLTERTIGW